MKILSAAQLYEAYNQTVKKQEITALDILERAGTQIFNWMHMRMQGAQVKIHVFCGIGNNGGVGLVLARLLLSHGYHVTTYVVNYSKKRTEGFLDNYEKIKTQKKWPEMIKSSQDFPEIHPDDIIVDAIFGIGLNRETSDYVKELIQYLNNQKAFKLSVDIPSGLYANKIPIDREHIIFANYTLSFQSPKLVFFLPETAMYTEQWEVLDIGLDLEYLYEIEPKASLIGKRNVLPMYKARPKFSNKFSYGHALLIGGSFGKIGALTLASKAALISGCGLVTVNLPKCGYQIIQTSFPEAMVRCSGDEDHLTEFSVAGNYQAIGIGCGMGTSDETKLAFIEFIKENKQPLVLDADALNLLAEAHHILPILPKETILTPHKKELERLIGSWSDDFDMIEKSKIFSKVNNVILVLKDAITLIISQDKIFVNSTGNTALATAGSGDCLTGIITGLLAQGYAPLLAAIFACYLHGTTADIGLEDKGYQSFIASDILNYLPNAYLDLFKSDAQETTAAEEQT